MGGVCIRISRYACSRGLSVDCAGEVVMSQRTPKNAYWQDAPAPREQLVLFTESLESRIPDDHPVRLLDEILGSLDWTTWEAKYHGRLGQPPIHPRIIASVLLFAMIRRVRSSRNIEYQIRHSIDFMWLVCRTHDRPRHDQRVPPQPHQRTRWHLPPDDPHRHQYESRQAR